MRSIVLLPLSLAAGVAVGWAFFRGPAPLARVTEMARVVTGGASGVSSSAAEAPGTTDEKAQRLIAAVLRKGDRLDRMEELYQAIEALTAEDFRRLVADPGALKAMAEKLGNGNWQTIQALASGLIARWVAVDPGAAVSWVPRMLDLVPKDQNARSMILDALAKQQPAELLALVPSRKNDGERAEIINRALRELAVQDMRKARAWLDQCTNPEDRSVAEKALRLGAVQADPLQAVGIAASLKDRREASGLLQFAANSAEQMGAGTLQRLAMTPMEPWMLPQVALRLAQRDPERAIDLLLNPSSPINNWWPWQLSFTTLAQQDPARALARLENLTGAQLSGAVSSTGLAWAESEPAAALAWLASRSPDERANPGNSAYGNNDTLLMAYGNWAQRAEGEARAWADALPAGATRDAIQTRLAQTLAANDQLAEATQLLARIGSGADPKAFASIAGAWAMHDPQAAADWAIAQPAGPGQSQALASIVGQWANNDPQSVGDWLAQFPAGEARDQSVSAFLNSTSMWSMHTVDRIEAFDAWFDLIDDPWRRAQAAQQSFWMRAQRDPAGARAWLASLPNLDPELVRITLRDAH